MLKKMKKAFTITELVIVIAVIAILAAVLIPTFTTVVNKANESAAMQEAKSEWTTCSAEIVTTVDASKMNYLIVRDGYAFVVANGNFEVEPVTDAITGGTDAIEKNDTFVYKNDTYTVGDQVYGFDKDGTVVKAPAEGGETVTADGYAFSSGFTVYLLTVTPGPQG